MHVYRWDLDKTYLDTDIDSVRGLLRAAVEPATRKRNVPGSAALLRSLERADDDARVYILSGSPEQMRTVIEDKLRLDGVHFHRLTLKDNLGNLKRGRLKAVRGQVGYKLPRLLEQRLGLGNTVKETLFGDDSEADAAIYALYADALAGRVDADELTRVIEAAGAYPDGIRRAVDALGHLPRGEVVEDIFIRMEPRVPLAVFRHLGSRVTPVFSWFQAAAILYTRGRVDAEGLGAVALACRRAPHAWAGWLVDLVRRSLLTAEQAERAVQATVVLEPASDAMRRSIARLGQPAPPDAQLHRDYLGFLRSARGRRVS